MSSPVRSAFSSAIEQIMDSRFTANGINSDSMSAFVGPKKAHVGSTNRLARQVATFATAVPRPAYRWNGIGMARQNSYIGATNSSQIQVSTVATEKRFG